MGGLHFGLTAFCTDRSATPADVAVAVEAAGFAVLLFPDHTHVPVSRRVPFPGGGDLPEHYLLRERVLAMKAIWTDDEASFHGEHVSFDELWSWPKPVRPGGPPIIVGGDGDGVLARVLEYGDEWLVMPAPDRPPLAERIATLWSEADRRGRSRPTVSCQLYGEPRPELVERLAGAGVGRIDLAVAHGSAAQVQDEIGRLGELVAGGGGGGGAPVSERVFERANHRCGPFGHGFSESVVVVRPSLGSLAHP